MSKTLIQFTVDQAKGYFFDREKIIKALDKAEHSSIFRGLMLVRKIAQRSMRSGGKKKKRSLPGQPPRYHGTKYLRKFLYAAYDTQHKVGVAGPTLLTGSGKRNHGKTVPETLEYGGEVDTTDFLVRGEWISIGDKSLTANAKRWAPRRNRVATIEPRPYMKPAYEKAKPSLMKFWQDSMHRSGV